MVGTEVCRCFQEAINTSSKMMSTVAMFSLADPSPPLDLVALASSLLQSGEVVSFEPLLPPSAPSFGQSMNALGYQLPPPIDTAPVPAQPVEIHQRILDVERAWLPLSNKIATQIVDSEENRILARDVLYDVMTSPYRWDHTLYAPPQDRWVDFLDHLHTIVEQWADVDEMHLLVNNLETAFCNMVSWLSSLEDPNAYFDQYAGRAWHQL